MSLPVYIACALDLRSLFSAVREKGNAVRFLELTYIYTLHKLMSR